MSEEKIREIQKLFMEFIPLYHKKLSLVFREDDDGDIRCHKNQKRAILMIQKEKGVTLTELGRFMDMRKGSLTSLIDSLVENGLVERRPDKTDRRMALLYLTPRGEDYYRQLIARYTQRYFEVFSRLSEDEIDKSLEGMNNVVAALKKI